MNNRIQRGSIAELTVIIEALKRGYIVSSPISHNSHYDLIIDDGKKILRCQIKRAFTVKDLKEYICWVVEGRRISGGKVYKYPDNSYDFLIACKVDEKEFWIIPKEEADKYKTMVYLGKKLEEYKNNWF